MAEDTKKKRIEIGEIAGGLVAGATMAHLEGKIEAGFDLRPEHVVNELTQAREKALEVFKAANPMPTDRAAVTEWYEKANKAAKETIRPLESRFHSLANPLTRPFVVFKEASLVGKTILGVIVVSTALGVALGINKWRNRNVQEPETNEKLTHVQRENYRQIDSQLGQRAGQVQGQSR